MSESPVHVGFIYHRTLSEEQHAVLEWLSARRYEVETVPVSEDDFSGYDLLWWHRDDPVSDVSPATPDADAIQQFVADGGGLLLTLRGMAMVEPLGIDSVGPDAVGEQSVGEPAGVLWRSLYDDHPAVSDFDTLRIPLYEHGTAPYARYEDVLPAEGEVLASTVRSGVDVLDEMPVVSWQVGDGTVLGVGAPLAFQQAVGDHVEAHRSTFFEGLLDALSGDAGPSSHYGRPKDAEDFAAIRASLADDPCRPRYHLTAPANWLNDPNGLIEWNGRYHVFYQYNPAGPFHHAIHWGHAVSDDLVHWEDRPVALTPSPDGPDRDGCWSGCAIDDDGTATLLYTGGRDRKQLPCLATTDDPTLDSWTKHADNPIIEETPTDIDVLETEHWQAEFRDHNVWRDDDQWYQIIGTGIEDVGGAALLYTSEDLRNWDYVGPLLVGSWDESGQVWECPELLDLGEKQLLHVSNYEEVNYFIGEFDGERFAAESTDRLDHGDYYAPQSLDDGDRYVTWGWLPEARNPESQWDAGWSGALSMPRVVSLGDDGRLRQRPADEVEELRAETLVADEQVALDAGERQSLDASGRALELELEVKLEDAEAFELVVFESPDGDERTPIRYTAGNELVVERGESSLDQSVVAEPQRIRVTPYDEPLTLRVFLDGSIVELFANERHCLTSRVYPTREDSTGVSLWSDDGRTTVSSLSVWRLESAWKAEAGQKQSPTPSQSD
ncbi:glycoside hydrolase family 32 protein [Halorussus halophilus]|uniref:glycoside hydrolase family 32 protein n=1 Tax=Halorussus halophilus TaxID=2650975 RepID=UPI0013013176|nr:glycoside hydrolase family 32 protein [Halorussus halophilus]